MTVGMTNTVLHCDRETLKVTESGQCLIVINKSSPDGTGRQFQVMRHLCMFPCLTGKS